MTMNRLKRVGMALLVSGTLTLSACGSDSGSGSGGDYDPKTATAQELIDAGVMDEEGVLAEPATITLATADPNGFSLPMYLAAAGAEPFKRRNLTVETVSMPGSNAFPLMATGKLDGNMGAADVGLFNQLKQGVNIRLVAPSQVQNADSADGLYCSTKMLGDKEFDISVLKGKKIGSSQKNYGISMVYLAAELKAAGMDVTDVELVQLSMTDQIAAVENGSLDCALLLEPVAAPVEAQGKMKMVQRQMPDGFPNGAVIFGSSVLDDHREIGYAYVAAYRELIEQQLGQPGWIDAQEDKERYSEVVDKPSDYFNSITPPIYDLPLAFPDGYVETLETTWRNWPDLLQFDEPMEKDELIDTSFMEFANGLGA